MFHSNPRSGAGWKLRCRTFPKKTLSHWSSQFLMRKKGPTDQGKARQYYQDTCRFDESSIHHAASWKPRAWNNDWHNQYLDIKHVNDIRCVSSSIFFGQIGWFGAKNPLNNMSLTWNCRNSTGKCQRFHTNDWIRLYDIWCPQTKRH